MTPEEREKRLQALEKRDEHNKTASTHEKQHVHPVSDTREKTKRKLDDAEDGSRGRKTRRISEAIRTSVTDGQVLSVDAQTQIDTKVKDIGPDHEIINLDSDEEDADHSTIHIGASTASHSLHITQPGKLATWVRPATGFRYPFGKVLLTAAAGYTEEDHHTTLEKLLEKDSLRRAVLSGFQIDLEWILAKLNVGRTAIHIVCEAKNEETKQQWRRICDHLPKLNVIFPPMNHANCMHSKLQLLFFDDYLRIVVPSANLMSYDWGESGTMENVMYVQDFPLIKVAQSTDDTEDEDGVGDGPAPASTFLEDLSYFLRRSEYPSKIIDDLEKYSFINTSHVRFVASIGGENYAPDDIHKSGLLRLSKAVQSLQLDTEYDSIEYITASIGALNKSFVTAFVRACKGTPDPFVDSKCSNTFDKEEYQKTLHELRIYFPSKATVSSSRAGHAGTICFQPQYYAKHDFPKESLMDHVAVRKGLLSHCKMIICRGTDKDRQESGWAYVGSANFSASAWGDRIVKDRTTKRNRMNCRNWECGVVVPLSMIERARPAESGRIRNTDPWFFMEQ